jgi:peptide/nickel transport system permease protein
MIIPMLLGISLVMFLIMHMAPGDPASIRYGLNPEVSESARAEFSRIYGLDQPVIGQYLSWLKRFFTFDFGNSLIDDQPVIRKILTRLPATIFLQALSLAVIIVVSIPMGVISGIKRNSGFDKMATIIVFTGYAMPAFWLALLLIYFFGFKFQIFPVSGMSPWYCEFLPAGDRIKDLLWHAVLPVFATSFGSLAVLSRYSRSGVIGVMNEPFVLAARAKGLTERRIIIFHILKNSLLPIVTILGLTFPVLISGSFIFESIFAWPGMGRLGYEAIMGYDYPVVMGIGVVASLLTLFGILVSDITYAMVDPRIRLSK